MGKGRGRGRGRGRGTANQKVGGAVGPNETKQDVTSKSSHTQQYKDAPSDEGKQQLQHQQPITPNPQQNKSQQQPSKQPPQQQASKPTPQQASKPSQQQPSTPQQQQASKPTPQQASKPSQQQPSTPQQQQASTPQQQPSTPQQQQASKPQQQQASKLQQQQASTSPQQASKLQQQQASKPPPQQASKPPSQQLPSKPTDKVYQLPRRPDIGKQGRPIKLDANFYALKVPASAIIHHYDVTLSDGKVADKLPKSLGRSLIEHFVTTNKRMFKTRPVFDGKKNMYTKEPLDFQGPKDFDVEFEEDSRKRKFIITLKWVGQIDLSVLQAVAAGKRPNIPQDVYQGLDLVLRHAASLRYVPVGSKFFQSNGAVNLGAGREMWPGYIQTVRPTDRWKVMLNIDISATAFYRHISVLGYLQEILPRLNNVSRELNDADRRKFEKEIKGLKIQITYMGNQKRKYRVNKLTRQGAATQTFELDNKEKISVQQYFKNEKKITLKYPNLNCLHVGNPQKSVYIPMELCEMVPGQRCVKKLTEDQTSIMIKSTAKRPHDRKKAIDTIVHETANYKNDPYTKSFGLQVDTRMTEVDARVLNPPGIEYQNQRGPPERPSGGAWNMRNKRLYLGATINAWALLVCNFFGRPMQPDLVNKFAVELVKSATGMGITMGRPIYQKTLSKEINPSPVIAEAIKANPKLDLLVVILPGKTDFYGNLKRMCETEKGHEEATDNNVRKFLKEKALSTQCIQAKNASKCNAMTLAQLCLKINAKMGGVNNIISNIDKVSRPLRVFQEPVIFMGADVTHPGIGDKESPSIAAIVGSVDAFPSRYAVSVRVQKHRVEVIEDMKNVTIELLKQFYRETKAKPCKIIMYRDGVSEGQFQQVLQSELYAIQQACTALDKGYQPSITFIVVQKRHHARFFVKNRDDADRSGNCPPGTTIDTGICHPVEYDYYQYSHSGIQGTSRPSHYHVLYDDNNFRADELQALSFMLCHLYVRCTRSVSIPAPAYYAHHVAFRAKDHLAAKTNGDDSSSERSDVSSVTGQLERLNLKEIVKPHPRLHNRMYFV